MAITITGECVTPTITVHPASKTDYLTTDAATALSVTASANNATLGYQWQSSPDNSEWTNISGATSSSYTPNISSEGTTYYRAVVTNNTSGCSTTATSNAATIASVAPSVCKAPTFSVAEGTYTTNKSVELSCGTDGATIRYTTDGTTPTESSAAYSSAISVTATTTIKAKAFKAGLDASSVVSATYTIQCATPTFSVAAGTHVGSQSVTISTTYGDNIYYTTDGTTPTASSTLYSSAITVGTSQTVKAIAVKSGCTNSAIASAAYTIQCATPTFSPSAGTVPYNQSVTISTSYGDNIYYTTDGSTPTTDGTLYSSAIAIDASKTVKAIAVKSGCANSEVASAAYTATYSVTWSVNGSTYSAGVVAGNSNVVSGEKISAVPTAPTDNTLSCANKFMGWSAKSAGSTPKTTSYYDDLFTDVVGSPAITGNTTFYAVFAEQSNSDGYKYIGDAGTLSDGEKYIFVSAKTAGNTKALKAINLPSVGNGTIGTAVDVTVVSNAEGILITTINTDLEFEYVSTGGKLQYIDNSTTKYLFVNGSGVGYKTNDSRSRYTTSGLQGWNNDVNKYYDVYYNGSTGYTKAENAASRVYAFKKQTPEYSNYVTECDANIVKVTYDANGGATTCAGGSHDKREDYTVCATEPTRDYYSFTGWLCSADGETYNAGATIDDAAIDADFTLTAQWTPKTYSITYNLNGGTQQVSPAPATSYTIESSAITLPTPTKGHDRFDGWYENADLSTGGVKTTIAAGSHENKTYYAKWTARHEIIFDYTGSASSGTTTIYRADDEDLSASVAGQGSVPSDPSAPTACSSKVFVGWSESIIDGETDTEPGDLMKPAAGTVDEDKHYYAVWANESSESGTVTVFSDDLSVDGDSDDPVSSRSGWTDLSSVFTNNGDGVRVSAKSSAGSMTIDLSDKSLESTITLSMQVKHYGSDDSYLGLSCMDEGTTASFSPTSFTTTSSSWEDKSCTITNVNAATQSITLSGSTSSKRIYIRKVKVTQTGTVYTYSAYSTSCCATNVTLSQNSPEHGTITFGKATVPTCGGDQNVSLTITPAAGYQLSSYEVATGSGKVAAKSVSPEIALNNNSSAAQNITLTFAEDANGAYDVTAAFSLMTVTSWTWTMHDGGGSVPNPLNLYVGQSARLDVAYTPAGVDVSKQTYTRDKDNTYINWVGGLQSGYSTISGKASTGENTTEVTFTHADGPSTTVNVKVLPLPLTHFADLVHGKAFADVAATIVENALSATKNTPISDDWVTPNANTCEENHLHLVGWIREDWPALVAYLNGTGDAPSTAAIIGAGNDGEGHAYFFAPNASINVQTFNGVTFYAVWAEVK